MTHDSAGRRETLLVVGSGYRAGHERLLAQMAADADLILLNPEPVSWQRDWVQAAEVFDPADGDDGVLRTAKTLVDRRPVAAVVTYEETMVVTTARLAQSLGLPGVPVAAAELARDKHRQRTLLNSTGISPTRSVLVHDLPAARRAAQEIGYPLMVKPRGLSGSAGVRRVDEESQFDAAFDAAVNADKRGLESEGVLVEEFLEGFEFDVDCLVHDGTATPVSWARKIWAYDPYPIEAGFITGHGTLGRAEMTEGFDLACRSVLAAGIDRTVAHVEVKMTPAGPRIIELNARPGGDIASRIVELARGVRLGSLLVSAALGRAPHTASSDDRSAGIRFLYPRSRRRFDGLAEAARLRSRPWVHEIRELHPRGETVAPPPEDLYGRVGYVMATGPHADEVEDRLLLAHHELRVLGS
uniref:ATP-grasp domain-containing protein n=1 Tax=Streptomyces miharaensis TaxID=285483 RepID=A0A4Y5QS43_9ACTN|nr:Mhr20 [Streptomyces miharaensis]QHD26304.1 ATP-grasp domain-containing protein [Streptomyces miharaensis]